MNQIKEEDSDLIDDLNLLKNDFKELQNEIDKGESEILFNRDEIFEKSKHDIVMDLWKDSQYDEELKKAFQIIISYHEPKQITEKTQEIEKEPHNYKRIYVEISIAVFLIVIYRLFFE